MSDAPHPELLAPAGDWECVRAAVANGADAVYFGLPRFNARLRAENFTEAELPTLVAFCHRHGVKAYVAMNTLIFTGELEAAEAEVRRCNRAGVDALIVQDVGLVQLARAVAPELAIHASTQMTVTSPAGAQFARELGCERVVLARELSLRELEKFEAGGVPLEVFVHGALCVAYSGQCLTSETLGRRSANRGECAQACRMPYELVVDGALRDLGDRRYLLSPQDLAAAEEIPRLLERGVVSFKIEGRLKSPEYVAAVCRVYRRALDAALAGRSHTVSAEERYGMEMTFSRGLFSGWMHGVDHQRLVSARYGKKRGPLAGRLARVGRDYVEFTPEIPLAPGDGVVFDTGGDTNAEQGGRIYERRGNRFFFQHEHLDFARLQPGDRVWKTGDPELSKTLRQSFAGTLSPRRREPLALAVAGRAGEPMRVSARGVQVSSAVVLQEARTAPLSTERLREHLGRLGESRFALGELRNELEGAVILPIGELNRLRRELLYVLEQEELRVERVVSWRDLTPPLLPPPAGAPVLSVLCRTREQAGAAAQAGAETICLDFEDLRRYRECVEALRGECKAALFLATPRIQKASEEGFFRLIENAAPDGVLVRNLGGVRHWAGSALRRVGDFSLNIANPLSARLFKEQGLERLTVSSDLNLEQVLDLLRAAPPEWFELTLHQHMPMFHMEHCVFAAFLSSGSSFLDCGRPCEKHAVKLRDRVGMEHPLRVDVGCRNTLYNAVPQTGARFAGALLAVGLRHFRLELLEEDAAQTARLIRGYRDLLAGRVEGEALWRTLKAQSQLGVTRGTMEG